MMTRSLRADLGVIISASHNRFADNGIKMFRSDGYKLSDEGEAEIEELMDGGFSRRLAEGREPGRASASTKPRPATSNLSRARFPQPEDRRAARGDRFAHGAAYKVAPTAL